MYVKVTQIVQGFLYMHICHLMANPNKVYLQLKCIVILVFEYSFGFQTNILYSFKYVEQ